MHRSAIQLVEIGPLLGLGHMITEVCITVDTEFSIAGAFRDPYNRLPIGEDHVRCPVEGKEQGLGFILRTLDEFDFKATFFVETENIAYFGDAPMGRIVENLLGSGQDVQLHLHPCWRAFRDPDWAERISGGAPPNDSCADRRIDDLVTMIEDGAGTLGRWGASHPVALRTGNLSVDRNVYRAMAKAGLELASNIGAAYFPSVDAKLRLASGRYIIETILEVPVLSYATFSIGGWRKPRLLAITASSATEIEALLWSAKSFEISPIVIITHPSEFIKGDAKPEKWRRNRINQERLRRLSRFIAQNPNDFRVATFGSDGAGWISAGALEGPMLPAPLFSTLMRIVENKANDTFLFM